MIGFYVFLIFDRINQIRMLFRDIAGQNIVKEQLLRSVKEGRIGHAQLFAGGEGSGSLLLALAYAQYLNCLSPLADDSCGVCSSCVKAAKLVHPDIHFVFVNQGEGQALVEKFLAQQQLSLDNNLLDSGGRLGQAVGSLSLPTTLFYSTDGMLKNNHLGELSHASLKHALRHIRPENQQINIEE